MSDEQRMIEDYIPVKEISYESAREKVTRRRQGHLSTLHLWWARRPLAASRAAVYATFAPPAEGEARAGLPAFFEELCHWTGPVLPESGALTRAREVVSTAGPDGHPPRVLDMFAGGGAIPLEAQRLGAEAVAVELNPVAHLIQRCTLEFPQRYGARLREAVAKWGGWVIDQTQGEVGDLYPDIEVAEDGGEQLALLPQGRGGKRTLRPIAWLWTRTIPSPARGFERGMVPLVRQTWLSKKAGNFVALRPVVDREALRVRYELVQSSARTERAAIAEWGFDPKGQSVRGATTCPYSGTLVSAKDAKKAGKAGQMGVQLLGLACIEPGARGKLFLASEAAAAIEPDQSELVRRLTAFCEKHAVTPPTEPIQGQDRMNFKVPLYGLTTFDTLFTPRQQLTLLTLCKYTRRAFAEVASTSKDADFAAAVAAYCGLLVGRVADRGSTLCRWDNSAHKTANTYARQALPMVWDYAEANPFGGASGDARMQLDFILEVIDHAIASAPGRPAEVIRGMAQRLPLDDGSIDAVITDPPYYDNISYADLSDFFYVWHKRALEGVFPGFYATPITPKKPEAVAAPHRHGKDRDAAAAFYEEQMRRAFAEAHRVLVPGGPMVVVYAHKTTLGWSTLVDSLRDAGFQVTEAWPLSTEMPDRAGQMNTASLASSIFLVARKREDTRVGDYAIDVRPEMASIVEARVRALMAVGIGGADLVIAAVGAGLRPYTRYARVELPNGEPMPSDRFLDEVQREVLECILAEVFDLERAGVGQIDPVSRFYVLARYQYKLAAVEFGEINVLAQGVGVELSGEGSLSDGRLRLVAQDKSKVTVLDHRRRGEAAELGKPRDGTPAPLIDVLHRLLWLVEHDREKVFEFLSASRVERGRLRLLANALKGRALSGGEDAAERTEEEKAVDRLLAQWQRVVAVRDTPTLDLRGD